MYELCRILEAIDARVRELLIRSRQLTARTRREHCGLVIRTANGNLRTYCPDLTPDPDYMNKPACESRGQGKTEDIGQAP